MNNVKQRADELCAAQLDAVHRSTDRVFLWLLLAQWAFAIVLAVWLSPYAWEGRTRSIHLHVQIAVFFGALLNALPIALILLRPGWSGTRNTIAVVQMLWSALLIHLTGGRIETHFHVFGSLAFLAFYKDWRVLIPATVTVAADHFLRGLFWPESVYGTLTPQWWRFLEHAGWVAFEDVVLTLSCLRAVAQDRAIAEREARLEMAHANVEQQVVERTRQLEAEVAERKAQAEELRRAQVAAEAASRAKSEFLATMSHEIRTPMNGVIGFSNLLLETKLEGEQRDFTHTIKSSAENLLDIIDAILDFSKVESGRLELEETPYDLRAAATEVIALLQPTADEKGIALTLAVAADVPRHQLGDRGRVRQVLLNLVGNAVKFTEQGHVRVDIRLEAADAGQKNFLRISVSDTGIGVPEDRQHLLFKEFTQADSSTTRRYGGTGLGLAICKRLVELMGGDIGMQSRAGEGSAFWFRLPLKTAEMPAAAGRATPVKQPDQDIAHGSPTRGTAVRRVLLAEDNAVNSKLATRLLEKFGCCVDVARDGREALAMVKQMPYEIVFMDCQMPEIDGFDATRNLRQWEQQTQLPQTGEAVHRLPIIALTANAMKGDRERCMEAGMDDYLTKPIVPDELKRILETWLPKTASPDARADGVAIRPMLASS